MADRPSKRHRDTLSDYRRYDDCNKHMIGIMKISGKAAPRVICRACERERDDNNPKDVA